MENTPEKLTPADFHEIQYRDDSTNLDALTGFARLAASDRRDLLAHIEYQRNQMRDALQELLKPLPSRESLTGQPSSYDDESRWEAQADYQDLIRAAATALNIVLN